MNQNVRPLIVVSVGTDHHLFNRLIEWVDRWHHGRPDVDCFFQTGTSAPPESAPWEAYLGWDRLMALLASATAVVCHGGPATIMDARSAGVRPIVVPRDPALGEHVDNHQILFSQRLCQLRQVELAATESALVDALDAAVATPAAYRLETGRDDVDEAVAAFGSIADALMRCGGRARSNRRRAAMSAPFVLRSTV